MTSRDYRDRFELIPPKEETTTHHLGCDENVCKALTIDLKNGDIYITCTVRGNSLTRIKITPEELNEMTAFIHMTAQKELDNTENELFKIA